MRAVLLLAGITLGSLGLAQGQDTPEPKADTPHGPQAPAAARVARLRAALAKARAAFEDEAIGLVLVDLAGVGPAAAKALPEVLTLYENHADPGLRGLALITLGQIDPTGKVALPRLGKALVSLDETLAGCAASGLAGQGKRAKPYVPAIAERLAKATSERSKRTFLLALDQLGAVARSAFPQVLKATEGALKGAAEAEQERTLEAALHALGSLGSSKALPLLSKILKRALVRPYPEAEEERIGWAMGALEELGSVGAGAVPLLFEIFLAPQPKDALYEERSDAEDVLAELGAPARTFLLAQLKSAQVERRAGALDLLAPHASAEVVAPALKALQKDTAGEVRAQAAELVGALLAAGLESSRKALQQALVQALSGDAEAQTRASAARALVHVRPQSYAISLAQLALASPKEGLAEAAGASLWGLGPKGRAVLLTGLGAKEVVARQIALIGLAGAFEDLAKQAGEEEDEEDRPKRPSQLPAWVSPFLAPLSKALGHPKLQESALAAWTSLGLALGLSVEGEARLAAWRKLALPLFEQALAGLGAKEVGLREAAKAALFAWGWLSPARLAELAKSDPRPQVRAAVQELIKQRAEEEKELKALEKEEGEEPEEPEEDEER